MHEPEKIVRESRRGRDRSDTAEPLSPRVSQNGRRSPRDCEKSDDRDRAVRARRAARDAARFSRQAWSWSPASRGSPAHAAGVSKPNRRLSLRMSLNRSSRSGRVATSAHPTREERPSRQPVPSRLLVTPRTRQATPAALSPELARTRAAPYAAVSAYGWICRIRRQLCPRALPLQSRFPLHPLESRPERQDHHRNDDTVTPVMVEGHACSPSADE